MITVRFSSQYKAAEGSAGDSSKVGWWWSKKDGASVRTADPSFDARATDGKQKLRSPLLVFFETLADTECGHLANEIQR
jgi:hypothetical protein